MAVYCYECPEELLHNPILLPEDVKNFSKLVRKRGYDEVEKPEHRVQIAGRIKLLHEIIEAGLKQLISNHSSMPI